MSTRAEMQRSLRVLAGTERESVQLPRVNVLALIWKVSLLQDKRGWSLAQRHIAPLCPLSPSDTEPVLLPTVLCWSECLQRHGNEFKGDSRKPRSVGTAVFTALPKQGIHFNTYLAFANVSFPPMRLFLSPPLPMKIKASFKAQL